MRTTVIVSVGHFEWQVLRFLVRAAAEGQSPFGRELRIVPTRRTKDGTFLDALVAVGLTEVVGKPGPREAGSADGEPVQFRTRYALTATGRHAAEYGEYDRPFTPTVRPVTGLAAVIVPQPAAPKKGAKRGKQK